MNRDKANFSATLFTRARRRSPAARRLLLSTMLSSIGISIWLRITRLRKQPWSVSFSWLRRLFTALLFFTTISSVTMRMSSRSRSNTSLPLREARVQPRVGVRVADQRNLVAHLQHRVTVRVGQNAVAADAFDVTAGLAVDAQFTQVLAVGPGHQLRGADAVGADLRQVDLALAVGVQAAFAGDLLGRGGQVLVLQLRQVARAEDQADQTGSG